MHLTQSWATKEWTVCGLAIGIIVVLTVIGLIFGPQAVAITVGGTFLTLVGGCFILAESLDDIFQGIQQRFHTEEVR